MVSPTATSVAQYDQLSVEVHGDRSRSGVAAGEAAATILRAACELQGSARVVLASAPSQLEMLNALCSSFDHWDAVTLFHMDEYLGLPAVHPSTFRSFQQTQVLSRITPAQFLGIRGEADPAEECVRYAGLLKAAPLDLVCLGIGENGHLAFNDPPVADFNDPDWVKLVELDAACRQQQVNDGCFPSLKAVPRHALTLTIPALMSAKTIIASVPGPRKARAVRDALLGPIATDCPASILRTHANAKLYLDAASSSLLPQDGS